MRRFTQAYLFLRRTRFCETAGKWVTYPKRTHFCVLLALGLWPFRTRFCG